MSYILKGNPSGPPETPSPERLVNNQLDLQSPPSSADWSVEPFNLCCLPVVGRSDSSGRGRSGRGGKRRCVGVQESSLHEAELSSTSIIKPWCLNCQSIPLSRIAWCFLANMKMVNLKGGRSEKENNKE